MADRAEAIPICDDIERVILGSVQIGAAVMDALRTTLEPADFGTERHRRIWRAMCAVYDSGSQPDHILVAEHLRTRGELISLGGMEYLLSLDEGVPRFPSLDSYVSRLKEQSMLRRIVELTGKAQSECLLGTSTPSEIRDSLSKAVADLSVYSAAEERPVSTAELLDTIGMEQLLHPPREDGVRFPWERMNDAIAPLTPGQIMIVAAYTGKGKTSAALQIAAHATKQGKAVLFWTMEMSPRALFRRLIHQMTGASASKRATFDERSRERDACGWLYDHPIWFDSRSRTVPSFTANIRRLSGRQKIGLGIVDYLGLIRATGRAESRTREVGENSRSLKLAAGEIGIPLVVLSQFKRPQGESRDATIHDLKESGDVENDADIIVLINSDPATGSDPVSCRFTLGKQREGPHGFDIPMVFRPTSQSFQGAEEL